MVNLSAFVDLSPEDAGGWLEFLGAHEMAHAEIAAALMAAGKPVSRPPLMEDPTESDHWMDIHQSLHQSEAAALGAGCPDLTEVDWQDPLSVADWMKLHADVHAAENAALKIGA